MADLASYRNADRDIEQALIPLKRGAQLLKYGQEGKPKFYLFRLSNDESSLNWTSSSGERRLNVSSVLRIIPGQRTICKDKVEAEVCIAGLKALISSGQGGRSTIVGWSDGGSLS